MQWENPCETSNLCDTRRECLCFNYIALEKDRGLWIFSNQSQYFIKSGIVVVKSQGFGINLASKAIRT